MTLAARIAPILAAAVSLSAVAGSPFLGIWIGTAGTDRTVELVLVVEEKEGRLVAETAAPSFGSLGDAVPDLVEKDGRLSGTARTMMGSMRFDVAAKGATLEGTLAAQAPGAPAPVQLPLLMQRTIDARSAADARGWAGQLDAGVQQLVLGLAIAPDPAGGWAATVDIPAQGIQGIPSRTSRAEDGTLTIRLPVQGSARLTLREADGMLRGEFLQGAFRAPIEFAPHELGKPLPAAKPKVRPQDPKEPLPYSVRILRMMGMTGDELEGTLFVPEGASKEKPVPGVLLVTGSGPQDRDESIMGHRPFLVLADALARRGIAVLRCDDRGVGRSGGNFAEATSDDLASDAMMELLSVAGAAEVDPRRTGIIGHSEGGLLAAMAAVEADKQQGIPFYPAFVVMLAGPGVDGDAILRDQNVRLMRAAGVPEDRLAASKAAHGAFLDAVRAGADEVVLRAKARELVLAQVAAGGADPATVPASTIDAQADAAMKQMSTPWMKRFLSLDPAGVLRSLRCPVLALSGSLDTQVSPELNVPAIERALKEAGVPATVKVMPGLNHLFQPAKTGGLDEYAKIDVTMDPAVLATVADWVLAQPPGRAGAGVPAASGAPVRLAPPEPVAPPASR